MGERDDGSQTRPPVVLPLSPESSPPLRISSLPYLPKPDPSAPHAALENLPVPPTTVSSARDPLSNVEPVRPWDESPYTACYIDEVVTPHSALVPPKPLEFQDPYLYPSLTKHERIRLTMLWYYMRDVAEDQDLLVRLQDKLCMLRELIGWESAIIGIVDSDIFTRLVTAGMPTAIVPRRESTCSHTINQPRGSVLMLRNMANDWRFENSPPVKLDGLGSYAGTTLSCKTESGIDIALGSLCVASTLNKEILSQEKQSILVKFADMLTTEIVTTCQLKRQRQRRNLGALIAEIQAKATYETVETLVLDLVNRVFPDVDVSIQDSPTGMLQLVGRDPVSFETLREGLWEDSQFIDASILAGNHQKLGPWQTVRLIAHPCRRVPTPKFLVVASSDIRRVFDDVDSWFVEKCSSMILYLLQEHSIKEAIEIKDRFFRGMTHQLRTPIHAILGSCELLGEELSSIGTSDTYQAQTERLYRPMMNSNVSSYLSTIKGSGEELMSTINNMLKLNRWSEIQNAPPAPTLCNLRQFESDICAELHQIIPESELADITVHIQNTIPREAGAVLVDVPVLKECLLSLLVNAVQHTKEGSVIMTISAKADYSVLFFDVVDSGCGIKKEDQGRIFTAYETANDHSPGAGLGLTLASKIAKALNGSVSLVSSELSKGSHFRAEFRDPGFACPRYDSLIQGVRLEAVPQEFRIVSSRNKPSISTQHISSYLKSQGFKESENNEALAILDYVADMMVFNNLVACLRPKEIALCLLPAARSAIKMEMGNGANVHFFDGPFHTARLDSILQQVESVYEMRLTDYNISKSHPLACQNQVEAPALVRASGICQRSSIRALLVDDNPINLRIMRMYCEKRGIPFKTATDGQEAVEQFSNAPDNSVPTLILMDLQMPILDGASACEKIRELEQQRSLQPSAIFVVSGQDSPADKARSFKAGANEFFVKPAKLKMLDARINEYFHKFLMK